MEIQLKDVMARPFAEGITALSRCKSLDSETAMKVGRLWKKFQLEATAWMEHVDAEREALEKGFPESESDGVKQVARLALNKKLEGETETRKFEVKISPIDFKRLPDNELTPEQLVALEPVLTNVPAEE
jgi:hypothetical protein